VLLNGRIKPEGPALSGHGHRKEYPVFVSYMTRFDAGKIQALTGLPASLIYRLREGSVKSLSPETVDKFQYLYIDYWQRRLERGGVSDSFETHERSTLIAEYSPEYMRQVIKGNREIASRIVERRRKRDAHCPKYNSKWHSVKDMLRQMSIDASRVSSDWDWIAQYGSPKKKKVSRAEYYPRPNRPRQYEH
jgi:hypothetical protein